MNQTKYETQKIHEMLPRIKGWCQEGATLAVIAERLHVRLRTIYYWRDTQPEFANATNDDVPMKKRQDKYEILKIDEILPGIRGWCKEGATLEELALKLHVGYRTVCRWRKKYPEFAKAIRDGAMISNGALLNAAFNQAVGYKKQVTETHKVKRQRYDPETKKILTDEVLETVTYEKTIEADAQMTRFMLMNRLPEKFKARKDTEPAEPAKTVFRGMKSMTDEEATGQA